MKFFKDIGQMWSEMYRNNKPMFWIGAFGTFTSVLASLFLNITVNDPNMWLVLTLYTCGSVSLAITSYMARDSWMILLMTWYTFINTVGMIKLVIGAG